MNELKTWDYLNLCVAWANALYLQHMLNVRRSISADKINIYGHKADKIVYNTFVSSRVGVEAHATYDVVCKAIILTSSSSDSQLYPK